MITVPPSGHITLAVSRIRCASKSFSTPRTTNPVANTATAPEIGSRTGYIVPWGIQASMRESVGDHASTYVVGECAGGVQCWNAGVVRNHEIHAGCNVRHRTRYVRTMWGTCAAQFSLNYIDYCHPTPPHGMYNGCRSLVHIPLTSKVGGQFPFYFDQRVKRVSLGPSRSGQLLLYKISAHH